jgi:hypothetical protein
MGRYDEAFSLAKRSFDLIEALPNATPGDRLINLAVLASVESKTGRATAEAHVKRSLLIAETAYGRQHPRVGWVLVTYAGILRNLHRAREAVPLLRARCTDSCGEQWHQAHCHRRRIIVSLILRREIGRPRPKP